jgi:hypothetical protein
LVYLLPHGEKQRLPNKGRKNRSSVRTDDHRDCDFQERPDLPM